MAIHPLTIGKPQNDADWELWCKRLYQHLTEGLVFQRYKLPGAKQHGIDLYATDQEDGKVVAVQCKKRNRKTAVTVKEANTDLVRARKHFSKLKYFSIATTHESTDLQDWAMEQSADGLQVSVWTWREIEDELRTNRELYEELAGDKVRNDPKAELAYCNALVTQLDRMKLYALETAHSEVSDPQLTAAYVSLDLNQVSPTGDEAQRVQGSITIEQVLDGLSSEPELLGTQDGGGQEVLEVIAGTAKHGSAPVRRRNLLVLVGEAGRGKTTLLRYIAVSVAKRRAVALNAPVATNVAMGPDRALPWTDRVPFYREVRRADTATPIEKLACLASEIIAPIAVPFDQDWPARVVAAKRALVLLDGVDEVPIGQPRIKLLESIRKLVQANPETLFVISSRPAAAEGLRKELAALSPREAHVQPLAGPKLREFIRFWHDAVGKAAKELYHGETRVRRCGQITDAGGALPDKLDDAPQVKALMATPLLAALVCAYHLDRSTLPENRTKLMLALVSSLVHFHDKLRPGMPEWPAYAKLDEDDKLALLGSIAAEMVKNRKPTIAFDVDTKGGTDVFDRHITEFLKTAGWFKKADLPELRAGIKERTGVFHEVHRGSLSFVHNEFRDFLAARHLMPLASRLAELRALTKALADPDWHGLIYFAVTADRDKHPKGVADKLVRQLLAGLKKPPAALRKNVRSEKEHAAVLHYRSLRRLAFRLGGATPPIGKRLYAELGKVRKALLRPGSSDDAEIIAELGNRAVPELMYHPKDRPARRAACAYALRLIDLPSAREALQVYAEHESDWNVIDEVSQTIPVTGIPFVSRGIVTDPKRFRMTDGVHARLVQQAAGLVQGADPGAAFALLRLLPALRIESDAVARALVAQAHTQAACFAAESVSVDRQVTDEGVKVLARADTGLKALTELDLSNTQVTDEGVKALARADTGLKALTSLNLDNTQVTDEGVKALARADTGLKALTELNLFSTRLTDEGVKTLACADTGLKSLTLLHFSGTQVTDEGVKTLARADTGLKALTSLSLFSTRVTDEGVKALARADTGLKALTELNLWKTQVTVEGVKAVKKRWPGIVVHR